MNKLKEMHVALGVAIIASLCFAFPSVFMKLLIDEITPIAALTVRFLMAATFFPLIVIVMHKKKVFTIKKKEGLYIALLAFILVVCTIALFSSFLYIHANTAMLIFLTYPIADILLAWIFLREKITFSGIAAIILTLIGCWFIFGAEFGLHCLGNILAVVGSVLFAAFLVMNRAIGNKYKHDSQTRTTWLFIFCFVFFAVTFFFTDDVSQFVTMSSIKWLWLFLLGMVATVLPYACLSYAGGYLKSSVVSVLLILGNATSVGLVTLIFHEPMTSGMIIGGILVLAAFIITTVAEWEDEKHRFHRGV